MTRHTLRLALLLAAMGGAAHAQEPWSTGFKLVGGSLSGANAAGIGQEKNYGLAMWGAYPLSRSGSLEFEGGYRYFPAATSGTKTLTLRNKTDGYYGGAFYRHKLWFEGFYLQAGVRSWVMKATQTTTVQNEDGSSTKTELKGPGGSVIKPVLGAGLRFNNHYSMTLNAASAEFKNVGGVSKTGSILEAALLIHF